MQTKPLDPPQHSQVDGVIWLPDAKANSPLWHSVRPPEIHPELR